MVYEASTKLDGGTQTNVGFPIATIFGTRRFCAQVCLDVARDLLADVKDNDEIKDEASTRGTTIYPLT